jgi:SEC-C motif-containing protein
VCTSGKAFEQCCKPLLDKTKSAKTPQQLMRSRFSAFALGGHGDYLLETWLPSSASDLTAFELSQTSLAWQSLEVVEKSQKGDTGVVEFKAYFLDEANTMQVHHEISQFIRTSGRWLYVEGKIVC